MKKMLLVMLVCLLASCSSTPAKTNSTTISDLPGDIPYNDTQIFLSSVSFCEVYANHGYTGYCVVSVDRSNLSDDDIYWMLNRDAGGMQEEFEAIAYLTSEANSLERERLSRLPTIYDTENIYFVFYTEDVQREHLNDFDLSLQMIMSPEKSLTADTTQYYYFYLNAEEGVDYSDYNGVLSSKELDILQKALNIELDRQK